MCILKSVAGDTDAKRLADHILRNNVLLFYNH